jgi:hypothetical protein
MKTSYVYLWKNKRNRDKADPENGGDRHRERESAKVEWAANKLVAVHNTQSNWNPFCVQKLARMLQRYGQVR